MSYQVCGDDRIKVIARAKAHLLRATNIESSPEEMAVLDDFIMRCWQMGWLERYEFDFDRYIDPTGKNPLYTNARYAETSTQKPGQTESFSATSAGM